MGRQLLTYIRVVALHAVLHVLLITSHIEFECLQPGHFTTLVLHQRFLDWGKISHEGGVVVGSRGTKQDCPVLFFLAQFKGKTEFVKFVVVLGSPLSSCKVGLDKLNVFATIVLPNCLPFSFVVGWSNATWRDWTAILWLVVFWGLSTDHEVHAVVVEHVHVSAEVEYVEAVLDSQLHVGHPEHKPVAVSLGVEVYFHHQVVLAFTHCVCRIQIAALKVRLKLQNTTWVKRSWVECLLRGLLLELLLEV